MTLTSRVTGMSALLLLVAFIAQPCAQQGATYTNRLRFNASAQTIADNGAGTAATGTVTLGKSYVELTCSDANGCTVSVSETGAHSGDVMAIVNVSANTETFADSAGVLELNAGVSASLAQYDSLTVVYRSDRWVEVSRSQPQVGTTNTATLTGKTYDAEGTGNTLTLPFTEWWPAGVVDVGGAYSTVWSMHTATTDAPSDIDNGSTGTHYATLRFDDSATESVYHSFLLPSDWAGAIDIKILWTTAVTTGNVVWQVSTFCAADNETSDTSTFTYNTAQTITDAAKGTGSLYNIASLSSVTTTGCAAGELLFVKLSRNPAHASDTITSNADFHGMELTYRRAM